METRWISGGCAKRENAESVKIGQIQAGRPDREIRKGARKKEGGARGSLPVGKTDPQQRNDEIRSYEFRLPHEGNPDSP